MRETMLENEIRRLMRMMIDLERLAVQAEDSGNTVWAGELWARRETVVLDRSHLLRRLWVRQRRYGSAA